MVRAAAGMLARAIVAVHRAYLEAGADCLLTASYQVSAEGFEEIGHDPQDAAKAAAGALRASVALAEKLEERVPGKHTAQNLDRGLARTLRRDAA